MRTAARRRQTRAARTRGLVPALLPLLVALGLPAQAQTWTGNGPSSFWSDPLNWAGLLPPASNSSTQLTFAGTRRLTAVQNIASVFDLNSLSFASGAGAFTLAGSTLRFNGSARLVQDSAAPVLVANSLQIVDNLTYSGNGSATFAGGLASGNADPNFQPVLIKRGSGVLVLSGPSSFGGRVSIDEGQVRLKDGLVLQSADITINASGGLDLGQLSSASVGGLSGSGSLALGDTQLTVGGSNRVPAAYLGDISSSTGSLTKVGSGTLQLGGTTVVDNLRVQQGSVALLGGSHTMKNGSEGLNVGGGSTAAGGGASLSLRGGSQVNALGTTVQVDGVAGTRLQLEGTNTRLFTGGQTLVGNHDQGTLIVGSGATMTANQYLVVGVNDGSKGQVTVNAGGSIVSPFAILGYQPGALGSATVSGAGASWQTQYLGIGGWTSDARGGTGVLTIGTDAVVSASVSLDFWTDSSSVTVAGGRLVVGQISNIGGAVGNLELLRDPAGGVALTINGPTQAVYSGRISGAGGLLKQGNGTQILEGANTFTGMVQVGSGILEMTNSAASEYLVTGGTLRLGERALGSSVVQVQPGGTVVYTGSSFSGGILAGGGSHNIGSVQRIVGSTIANGATLVPATGSTFSGVTSAGTVINNASRTLTWSNGSNTVGTLAVAGTTSVSGFSSGGVIRIVPGGTLSNTSADLLLAGGSRTTIGSAATQGGALQLLNGTTLQLNGGLLVNNGTITGPVNVNYGGLAKGAGTYGAVTVNDGGRFSPGNSPGLVQTGSATWGAGGGYVVELASATGSAGSAWDLWSIGGTLDITAGGSANSRFTISVVSLDANDLAAPLAGFDNQRDWSWQIAHASGGITGFDPALLALDTSGFASPTAGGSFSLARQGGDLYLVFAPVPEPAPWMLVLMCGGIAALSRRQRAAR